MSIANTPRISDNTLASGASFFFLGFYLLLIGSAIPTLGWWELLSFLPPIPDTALFVSGIGLLSLSFLYLLLRGPRPLLRSISPELLGHSAIQACLPVLLLLFFSNWLDTDYSFLRGPLVRGEILLLFGFCLFLTHNRPSAQSRLKLLYPLALSLTLAGMFANYLLVAQGRLLFSDDHPSFLFRLLLFRENFPNIPIYYVHWNAGWDFILFSTGIFNVLLLFAPLLYSFPVEKVYTYIPLIICIVLVPLSSYAAARLCRLTRHDAALSALLAVCSSLFWYRWALKYGTLGFCISAALLPLVLSLIIYCSREKRFPLAFALTFVALTTLIVLWPLATCALLPLGIFVALSWRNFFSQPNFILALLLLALLNAPWMLVDLLHYSGPKVLTPSLQAVGEKSSHAESEFSELDTVESEPSIADVQNSAPLPRAEKTSLNARSQVKGLSLKRSVKLLREQRASLHPILLLLTLPGLFFLPGAARIILGSTIVWLLALSLGISPAFPKLELDRFLVVAAILAATPSALAISQCWNSLNSRALRCAAAFFTAFALAGASGAVATLGSKRIERFYFAGPFLNEFTEALKENAGPGRILFSGFVLHELERGHIAPLSIWSGKPMIASSPFHNVWRYQQVFPEHFMARGDAGIEEYLDLFNVTAVVAHERHWREYFKKRSDKFTLRWQGEKFAIFSRNVQQPTYFLQGEGEITAQPNSGVRLRLASPEAVIKFRYFSSLISSGCEVSPYTVAPGIEFVKLSNCQVGTEIELRSRRLFERLLGGLL